MEMRKLCRRPGLHLTKRSLSEEQIDGSHESVCSSSLPAGLALPAAVALLVAPPVNQAATLVPAPATPRDGRGLPDGDIRGFGLSVVASGVSLEVPLTAPLLLRNSSIALPRTWGKDWFI